MSDEQINEIISHEITLEDSHPRGEKPKYFGEIMNKIDLFTYGLVIKMLSSFFYW